MIEVGVETAAAYERLGGIVDRLEGRRDVLQFLGGMLEDYERDVFATRGHGRWAADDPATMRLKRSGRVLVDTGNLLRELTTARVDGESVAVGAGDAYYAQFLREGARGMPRRDPAPEPSPHVINGWAEQLLGYLTEGTP